MRRGTLYNEHPGDAPPGFLGTHHTASKHHVDRVLAAKEGDDDGRSAFQWFRLANGDLILGVFPHGDTYIESEDDAVYPE